VGRPEGHVAAALGDIVALKELARDNKHALHAKDQNGWMPLHEAVRAGHMEAVALLVEHGADINAVTNNGVGVSPYYIAKKNLTPEHPVSQYLQSLGALDVGPEL
jgi:ankyrin repeat protein